MPYGPQGQWRPADPGARARLVCDIATGESPEVYGPPEDRKLKEPPPPETGPRDECPRSVL